MSQDISASHATKAKQLAIETAIMYPVMILYAVFVTLIGTLLKDIIDEFIMPMSQGGIFMAVLNTGCFCGIVASGFLVDRLGKRGLILASFAVVTAVSFAIALSSGLTAYLALLFVGGVAAKFMDTTMNSAIAQMHPERKGFYLNLLHGSFGVGSFLGPVLTGSLLQNGYAWRASYLVVAVACCVLLAVYLLVARKNRNLVLDRGVSGKGDSFRDVLQPKIILLCVILVLYCGHQIGLNNWLPTYFSETYGIDPLSAGFGLSLFWLGLIVGRLICSVVTKHVNEKTLIVLGGLLAGVILLAGVLVGNRPFAYAAAICAGLFAGAMIPMALTLGYTWFPRSHGKVSMLLFAAVAIGSIIFPWLMGVIEGYAGLKASMVMNAVLLALTGVVALFLPNAGSERGSNRGLDAGIRQQ